MREFTLKEYIHREGHTQNEVAMRLGITQGAVSQMLLSDRDIRVVEKDQNTLQAYELKTVPAKRAVA